MPELLDFLNVTTSSGGLVVTALIWYRLSKLEKTFEKHNERLGDVQTEVAFVKGKLEA